MNLLLYRNNMLKTCVNYYITNTKFKSFKFNYFLTIQNLNFISKFRKTISD